MIGMLGESWESVASRSSVGVKKVEDSGSVAQGCGFVIEERSRS